MAPWDSRTSRSYTPTYDYLGDPIPRDQVAVSGVPIGLETMALRQHLRAPIPPAAGEIGTLPDFRTRFSQGMPAGQAAYWARRDKAAAAMAKAIPHMGKAQLGRDVATAGVGILGEAARLGVGLSKTETELENARKIAALRRGRMGLSRAEYARHARQVMEAPRALISQMQKAEEARTAGAPTTRSAATLARGQRESRRALSEAGQKAGQFLVEADVQRAQQMRQELAEREAYEGIQQDKRKALVMQAIPAVAKPLGQLVASIPVKTISPEQMEKMVRIYGPENAIMMAQMARDMGPGQRRQFVTSALTEQQTEPTIP